MKKVFIYLCMIFIIFLAGCNDGKRAIDNTVDFEKMKSKLAIIPKDYSIHNAIKDGCFVIKENMAKSDLKIMDKFISDSKKGKVAAITIVNYFNEKDIAITKVIYDGEKYYCIGDETRTSSDNEQKYYEMKFKYLEVLEGDGERMYCLINDNTITYSQIINSMLSSSSYNQIPHNTLYWEF